MTTDPRPDRLYVSATAGSSLETGHLRGPVDALTIKTTDIAVDSENPQRIYRGFRSPPARGVGGPPEQHDEEVSMNGVGQDGATWIRAPRLPG